MHLVVVVLASWPLQMFVLATIKQLTSLQWRHNKRDVVSNHQPHDFLLILLSQVQFKENIKAPRHWPLCGEFTGGRWIPHTKGHYRGKCFHLMTSSCWHLWCNGHVFPQVKLALVPWVSYKRTKCLPFPEDIMNTLIPKQKRAICCKGQFQIHLLLHGYLLIRLGADQETSHDLNQWWLNSLMRICITGPIEGPIELTLQGSYIPHGNKINLEEII